MLGQGQDQAEPSNNKQVALFARIGGSAAS